MTGNSTLALTDVSQQPCIFIASLGRTGTHFLGRELAEVIEGCTSVHEPDVFAQDRPPEWLGKLRRIGVKRATVGKFMPRYSLRILSARRQMGLISDDDAWSYLLDLRKGELSETEGAIYLEANAQLRGVLDLLPLCFPNSRTVFIVRDPRSWVRSWLNRSFAWHSRLDWVSWFPNGRLRPKHSDSDPYRKHWGGLELYEKLCWAWNAENRFALASVDKTEKARIYRFEDVFQDRSLWHLRQMLEFVTDFPSGFRAKWSLPANFLDRPSNISRKNRLAPWHEWSCERARILERHCGELMRSFGYGLEDSWRVKLRSA